MHLKHLKSYPVKCSFCKEKTAKHKIVGHPYGGRTVCDKCSISILELKSKIQPSGNLSEAEEQLYSNFKVF
jgi:hypothetical protein